MKASKKKTITVYRKHQCSHFCISCSHPSKHNNKTFRPAKHFSEDSRYYKLQEISDATLGTGDLTAAVVLPPGTDPNDWIATHAVDFYNQINALFAPVSSMCTHEHCPKMTAGPQVEYLWQDGKRYPKPTSMPACEYITNTLTWTEELINDESIFPPDPDVPFPKNFRSVVESIYRRLFRIYAHIYHHHHTDIQRLGVDPHMNTSFKHFYLFSREFNLIPEEQFAPLRAIIGRF